MRRKFIFDNLIIIIIYLFFLFLARPCLRNFSGKIFQKLLILPKIPSNLCGFLSILTEKIEFVNTRKPIYRVYFLHKIEVFTKITVCFFKKFYHNIKQSIFQ